MTDQKPLGRIEEWAFSRWCVRRFNQERGYGYPRWWRARRARRAADWVESLPHEAPALRRMAAERRKR